jgi:large subunit ribosomal protein L40e
MAIDIIVKAVSGTKFTITGSEQDTIADVKQRLHKRAAAPCPEIQRLIFAGKELQNSQTLASANFESGSEMHLVVAHGDTVHVDRKSMKKMEDKAQAQAKLLREELRAKIQEISEAGTALSAAEAEVKRLWETVNALRNTNAAMVPQLRKLAEAEANLAKATLDLSKTMEELKTARKKLEAANQMCKVLATALAVVSTGVAAYAYSCIGAGSKVICGISVANAAFIFFGLVPVAVGGFALYRCFS